MRLRIFAGAIVLSTLAGVGAAAPAAAAPAAAAPVAAQAAAIAPVRPCADLVGRLDLPGAVTAVESATVVPAQGEDPEHCDVRGFVRSAVRFHLRLPITTYAGSYLQYGCGGFCGGIFTPEFAECAVRPGRHVAVAATDDGHVGEGVFPFVDGRWAANNRAARDDWEFRAPHVLSRAAKAIIAEFYGAPPRRSYFSGCSNGGREALLLAQRYPDDFDGIIAGAPAAAIGALAGVYQTWLSRTNTAADGTPILAGAKLVALHNAVLAACDGLDGLVDGQLEDPRACRFDPGALRCPAGADRPDCLTAAQVDAARKLYAGPTDERGRRLYPGGQPRGSELAWEGWITPIPEFGGALAFLLGDNYLRYIGYPIGTPHSSVADFTFTVRDFARLVPESVRGNALSLDLRRFRAAGGKLIIWHGWSDQAIPPVGTLDYYQRLAQRDGGLAHTRQYARVFMVPSMFHCQGGAPLGEFDPFPELVRWVERGDAPDRVVAVQRDEQGTVLRSRPVFPYPLRARYDGSGSVDDAANFVPVAPARPPRDVISWVGAGLHALPGPVAP
jgi:feruloyl esterase